MADSKKHPVRGVWISIFLGYSTFSGVLAGLKTLVFSNCAILLGFVLISGSCFCIHILFYYNLIAVLNFFSYVKF